MRLRQIQNFVAVVESGSIRAAARKLGVSQPAITKSVRGLEAELRSQLVQRTPQGIVPTPSGRAFFARARVVQAELRKAGEEVMQLGGEHTGLVTFGVGPISATRIMPEAVIRFRDQCPSAQLRIVEGYTHTLLPLVRDETLDLALAARPDAQLDPAFAFRPLYRFEYVVVARKGHPLRNARSLAQLANAEWISFMPPKSPVRPLDRIFSFAGLPGPRQMVQCDSYNVALALLAKTDMLGLISSWMLKESRARDLLQQIAVTEPMPSYTVGIFTRMDPPLTPLAAALARALTAVARQLTRRP